MRDDELIRDLSAEIDGLRRRGWLFTMSDGRVKAVKLRLTDDDLPELIKDERERPRGLAEVPGNIYTLIDDRIDRARRDAEVDDTDSSAEALERIRRLTSQFAGERFAKLCESAAFDAIHRTECGLMLSVPEADAYYEDLLPVISAAYETFLTRMLPSYYCEQRRHDD